MAEGKWISVLAAWEGSNDYGNYIVVKPEEGVEVVVREKGQEERVYDSQSPLYLNENKYHAENPKAPKYKTLRKSYAKADNVVETEIADYSSEDVIDNFPF